MRILVAHASKMGGTQDLAEWLGKDLSDLGFDVEVMPARDVSDLSTYQATVLGGALYTMRWHKDARRFVRLHRKTLRGMPLWLFSSGPLDESARSEEIAPVRFVAKTMEDLGVLGHVTFGGRLDPDHATGLVKKMAETQQGDWRDPDHVSEFAAAIAKELTSATTERRE